MKDFWKCSILAAALAAVGGCRTAEEEAPPLQTYTIEQFLKTTSVGGGAFSEDEGKLLVHSNQTGIFNVYELDIATAEMTPLTQSQDTTFAVAYLPGGNRFLFTRDEGGNELYKLYVQAPGEEPIRLTQGEQTREIFYDFAYDRKSFFTGNNSRDPRFMDVYEWDVSTLEPTLFYRNEEGLDLRTVSRDKRWMALHRVHNDFDSDMYLVDRAGDSKPVLISDPEGEVNHIPVTFSPDGARLYYLCDRDNDFLYLMSYETATGSRQVAYKPDRWDVTGISFSHEGTYQIITVNENAVPRHILTNLRTNEEVRLADLPSGIVTGLEFSPSERLLRFFSLDADRPSDLYVYDLQTERSRRLTDNLNPEIDPSHLVKPDLITLRARDGLEFYGYLYKPLQGSADKPVPALLWIHGGPGGQSVPAWSAEIQFLVNHGYAVFDLNYRGSGGFGRAFSMADDQKHGREPLYDCMDAKRWLASNVDWVDPERIGILGGSYGGYMVMAALAFAPDEFAVGVDIFGVTNWVRTLENTFPWWESFKQALYREIGNPEAQKDLLYEISPLFHAENIRRPVIILQGANDPRVLKVESDEMVEKIRASGGTVEYILFEDEGHGFTKTANRIRGWNAILEFLERHLKGGAGQA